MIRTAELFNALKRLQEESDRNGGFNEYSQFCEEVLIKLLPYLTGRGKELLLKDIQSCYCLEDDNQTIKE